MTRYRSGALRSLRGVLLLCVLVTPARGQGRDPFRRGRDAGDEVFRGLDPDDDSTEYLEYAIPENAERSGPFFVWGLAGAGEFVYRVPGQEQIVASELALIRGRHEPLVLKRTLFKDGKRHGVQREWHRNGVLESEIPCKRGILHGECRHYDEDGKLVGWYEILNGSGVRRIYHSNGRLAEEVHFFENREHGPKVAYHENGRVSSVAVKKRGQLDGPSAHFHENGELGGFGSRNVDGFVGPFFAFDEAGQPLRRVIEGKIQPVVRFYLRGGIVSEEEYGEAAELDGTLPPVLNSIDEYRAMAEDRLRPILEGHDAPRRVKVPLQHLDPGKPSANEAGNS